MSQRYKKHYYSPNNRCGSFPWPLIGTTVHGLLHQSPRTFVSKCTDFCIKVHGLLYRSPRTFASKCTDFRIKVHGLSPNPLQSILFNSTDRSLQRHAEQLLSLNGKLHGQLLDNLLGIAVDDEADSLLRRDAALVAIKELVF